MTRITLLLSLLALALAAVLRADPMPELAVPRTAAPPRVDGRLDEACWQTPAPITDFRCVDKDRTSATQRTEAWVVCDADALYVAARCHDDQMAQVLETVTDLDGPVWRDDCMEIFLMPGPPFYYHLAANLAGARYDARHAVPAEKDGPKPVTWNGEWQAAARREATCWTMEIAVPFACLEWGRERLAAPLRFNIGREQRRLAEFSCWPASAFNKTDEFAALTGVQPEAARYGLLLGDVIAGQVLPGANRFTATVAEEPAPGPMTLRARVRALPDGPEQVFTQQVSSAPGAALALDYQTPLSGGRVAATFECLDARGRLRASRREVWWVPAPLEAKLDLPLLYVSDGAVRLSGRVALRGEVKLEAALCSDSKRLAAVPVTVGPDGAFAVQLPVGKLPPGRYRVETRLTAPGTATAPVLNPFPFRLLAGPLD